MIPFFCRIKESQIMISIITMNSPHPIVGVPALWEWSFANISDFSPVALFSRIVFPALSFLRSLIYSG